MYKLVKKTAVCVAMAAMMIGLVTGCDNKSSKKEKEGNSSTENAQFDPDKVIVDTDAAAQTEVFQCGDEVVYMDEVYMYTLQCFYMNGLTYDTYSASADSYNSTIVEQIETIKSEYKKAQELEIELTDEEKSNVEDSVNNYINTFDQALFDRYGISKDTITKLFTEQAYGTALQTKMVGDKYEEVYPDYEKTYKDVKFNTFYYLIFPIYEYNSDGTAVTDEDGNKVKLSEDEIKKSKENAEEAVKRLKAGEKAEDLAKEYGIDNISGEQTGYIGNYSDTLNKLFPTMKDGDVSDVIEDNLGSIVIYMETADDTEMRDYYVYSLAMDEAKNYFDDQKTTFMEPYTITEDDYIDYNWYDVDFEDVCNAIAYYAPKETTTTEGTTVK